MVPMNELEDARASTRRWRKATLWAAAALVVAALAYAAVKPADESSMVGREVPEFELELLDGSGTISSDDLRGGPVVINFWASWCLPCREEAPLFEEAWQEHRDDGLTVLGVDLRDAPAKAEEFVDDYGVTYPIVVDPDEELAGELDVEGLPQTFFVDSEGRFQAVGKGDEVGDAAGVVVLGGISGELLDEQIARLLDGAG
ncbi:MAG TPA: TlpA disulfide reductase family protein [Actinomycetota bacterium]|jgi:cytochrome c biogenesis protein CcmG/thiol:disulfide interchange protein DsbE